MRVPKNRTLTNLKSLPRAKREVFRQQAYNAFKDGKTAYAVAKDLNLNESCVDNWYARFRKEGASVLTERRRGPATATNTALTDEELRLLLKVVTGTPPDQLMFDFAFWPSRAVVAFVGKRFKKTICRRTARRYLQHLGFTYQCPIRRAREQNALWLYARKKPFPEIRRMAPPGFSFSN